MSITQEQFDALSAGDPVVVREGEGRVIARESDGVWVALDSYPLRAYLCPRAEILSLPPPPPKPIAWLNYYKATSGHGAAVGDVHYSRARAMSRPGQTNLLGGTLRVPDAMFVIYDDGSSVTEWLTFGGDGYRATHSSKTDGSRAMLLYLVGEESGVFVNENGHTWEEPTRYWTILGDCPTEDEGI